MLKVGDKLPAGTLQEFIEIEGNGCSLGPNSFDIEAATAGKTIAIFDSLGRLHSHLFSATRTRLRRAGDASRRPVLTRSGASPSTTPS